LWDTAFSAVFQGPVGAFVHFIHEQRFNRDLLYDLLAKPAEASRVARVLAA